MLTSKEHQWHAHTCQVLRHSSPLTSVSGLSNEELKTRLTTAYRPYNIDEQNPTYKGKLGKGYIDAEAAFETDTKIAPEKVGTLTLKPDS